MGTIAENLLALQETKEKFKTAFIEKDVDVSNTPFTEYPNKFSEIKTSEDLDTELTEQETSLAKLEEDVNALSDKPKDMLQQRVNDTNSCAYLFYYYDGDSIDYLKNVETSNATDMSYMFYLCKNISSLDVSNFDTAKVTNMEAMFSGCNSLTSLDLSNFDTSNVTAMNSMFSSCRELTSLDLSNFDTSKVTAMKYMFSDAIKLQTLNLSGFATQNVTNFSYMFKMTSNTTTAIRKIIGELDLINATNVLAMFSSCAYLTDVTLKNIKKTIQLGSSTAWGTLLSNATLINTIQQLWDLTGGTSQTLTLSTTSKTNIANIYVKLVDVTDEMRAEDEYIDNKKPCVVCESTDEGAMTLTEYAISKNWAIA